MENLLWQNWSCHGALLKDDYWIQAIFKKWDRYCCLFYLKFYSVYQWNPIISVWILYWQNIIKYINIKLKALDLSVNLSLINFYIDYSIGVKEKSTRRGAQFVPMGMLMIVCKMCLPNLTIYSWLHFPFFFAYFHAWQISYFLTQYYINSFRYSLPCLNNSNIRRRNLHVFFCDRKSTLSGTWREFSHLRAYSYEC